METKFFKELTPGQDRVAVTFAQNGTRKDVAEKLGISYRTVSAHLDKIYLKLGVASQIELRNLYDKRKLEKA